MTAAATMAGDAGTIPAASGRLTIGRKLSLAVGDFGMNLYWQSITYFLLYFYTDVVGLSVGVAGTIYMAASIFDGCIDPLFGALIERTNTRWGKYRPWLVAGAAPLALSFMLIYWSPSTSGTALVVVVTAAHLLFRMCYTSVAVPMASLVARVTRDSGERASLTGYRMLFAAAGSMAVALGTRPLTAMLGRTEAIGFLWVAVLSGILASAIFLFVAARVIEPRETAAQTAAPAPTAAQRWRATFTNRAFCTLVIGLLGAQLAITVVSKSLIYYFKYVVKDVDASSLALTIVTSSAFVLVPFWSWLARKRGKREVWLTGASIAFVTLCLFLLVRPTTAGTATAFYIVMQIALVAMIVSYWSLLPDTVEFGELACGWRMEAFLVGLFMFFQKMGLGLAAGALGWALSLAGIGNMESGATTMATMLPVVIAVLAGGGVLLSGIATYFSPMKRGVHEDICAQLAAREQAAGWRARAIEGPPDMTRPSNPAAIRAGLIGLGAAGRIMHIPLINAVQGIELAAVCTSRAEVAAQIAPAARHHATPAALMSDHEVDLVVIATPNDSHAKLARAAILAGKHVLVEKPFCLDRAEAADLLRLAEAHRRVVCVFQNRRFDSDFLTVRDAIASGLCGAVRSFETRMERFKPDLAAGWQAPPAAGSGGWYDFGAHLVDQAVQLFGLPESVTARFASLRENGAADDWGQAVLGYARHEVAVHYSLAARGPSPRFVVHGAKASLFKRGGDPQGMQMMQGMAPGAPGWGEDADPLLCLADGAAPAEIPASPGDYGRFYRAMIAAIRGEGANPTPPEQILDVLAVLEAGIRAASEGQTISLLPTTEPTT